MAFRESYRPVYCRLVHLCALLHGLKKNGQLAVFQRFTLIIHEHFLHVGCARPLLLDSRSTWHMRTWPLVIRSRGWDSAVMARLGRGTRALSPYDHVSNPCRLFPKA